MAKSIHPAWILIGLLAVGCGRPEAPNFTAESMAAAGQKVRLSDFKGKVVVLDFWATWCGPCMATMPKLASMYQRLKDKGLVVMGITREERTTVAEFLKTRKVSYPLYLDTLGSMGGPTTRYEAEVLPTMIVIDRNGSVVKRVVGADADFAAIEKEIEALL